jgi:hypothetical protein
MVYIKFKLISQQKMFELMQSINHYQGFSFCGSIILLCFINNSRSIYYRLIILISWVLCQHCTYCQQWCIRVHMKLHLPIWKYQNWCFHVLFLDLIPSFLTSCGPNKGLCFPHQLGNWCHDKGKNFGETSIKLSHTIKDLNMLWVCRYWLIHYCLSLLRVWYFSFLGNYEL